MKLPQWLEMTHREMARQQALEAQMLAQHHKEQAAALIATATQVGGGASRELVWGGRSVTGSGSAR